MNSGGLTCNDTISLGVRSGDLQESESQVMKVSIKDLAVSMEIKNKGIELDVYDNQDNHLGDLVITKTRLVWCKGRTSVDNGKEISWADFIAHMESLP
jgi:hypothetical protein